MVLYLFGGSSPATEDQHDQLLTEQLALLQPKQLLYIDFARTNEKVKEQKLDKIRKTTARIKGCRFLYARAAQDVKAAVRPLIYISGGESGAQLLTKLKNNSPLLHLVAHGSHYFGSSAGAMIVGEKVRDEDDQPPLTGLNLLPQTVIEPHYTQGHRQKPLRRELKDWGCRYGLGIDEACGIIISPQKFPREYQKIGGGVVEVIRSNSED